jgi:cytidyltransferase-like protein
MQRIIVVSGYFNPIHKSHLEYFINAKTKGNSLFVIFNSDHQHDLKGSRGFQKEDERLFIVQHIKDVD